MNIIKSLPVASRLNPGLADDLEVFFPEWLSTLLTFYNEARSGGDFAFHMMNTCGSGSSYTVGAYDFCRTRHYYGNGYHTLLSFYGGNRLFRLDWKEMFRVRYGYEPSLYDKISLCIEDGQQESPLRCPEQQSFRLLPGFDRRSGCIHLARFVGNLYST